MNRQKERRSEKEECMNRYIPTVLCCICFFSFPLRAQMSAKQIAVEAAEKETAADSISYIKKSLASAATPADLRSLYALLGSVQEQMALFDDARDSYASAAGIAAADADGMPVKTPEQLVLDAVRCALSTGDFQTAESFLNSPVRNSKDETVQAYIRLYSEWCDLCKVSDTASVNEPVIILKAYSELSSLEKIKPQVLLTLWYITGSAGYGEKLKKEFPSSPEAAIVNGTVQMLPAPFWYFIPRQGISQPDIANTDDGDATARIVSGQEDTVEPPASVSEKIVRLQLGLFREQANAQGLVKQLKDKGFTAAITTEKRPSGTTYFIVVVDENADGTMGVQLRTAGFECYPVFSDK